MVHFTLNILNVIDLKDFLDILSYRIL